MASHGIPRAVSSAIRTEQVRAKEQQKIKQYRDLEQQVQTKIKERQYTAEVLALTSKLLSLNPEYYTIWNYRRIVLQDGLMPQLLATQSQDSEGNEATYETSEAEKITLQLIENDLSYLFPLLRNYPKCYWIWNHRRWLLQEANLRLPSSISRRLWEEELGLVNKMLLLDGRNFHGWGYRRRTVSELECLGTSVGKESQNVIVENSMAEPEFDYTTKMIGKNLSNFSAWHNRSKLIPRLLEERGADSAARRKLLDEEFELIQRALYTDPYDQSLWFYHQWLMADITSDLISSSAPIIMSFTNEERVAHLEKEIQNIQEMIDGAEDCKFIYEALVYNTIALNKLKNQSPSQNIFAWILELKKLDPLRSGRWKDLEEKLNK